MYWVCRFVGVDDIIYLGVCFFFFFQAEDGIRDAQESRGLGDVYKRQHLSGDSERGTGGMAWRPDGG